MTKRRLSYSGQRTLPANILYARFSFAEFHSRDMLCPHCGSESSDKARSCPSCGYKFVLETLSDVPADTAAQEKQLKRLFRAASALVILAAIFWLAIPRLSNRRSQSDRNL